MFDLFNILTEGCIMVYGKIMQLLAGIILVMSLVSYNILRTYHLFVMYRRIPMVLPNQQI